jgi:uncharacterized protein (TIGR00730 family)
VTHGVLGPDGRGVVVLAERRGNLREVLGDAGLPSVTPLEAGLAVKGRSAPGPWDPSGLARFVAQATRRAAVAREGDRWVVGAPDGVVTTGTDVVVMCREAASRRPPPRVTVFGGAWIRDDEPEYLEAMRFGLRAAATGADLINGGYGGIMAAVSRGAMEAGGTVVGVTIGSFTERVPVNVWLTHELVAEDLFARLPLLCDAEAWVAFPGGVGTLSEVALCWNLVQTESFEPRPLVIVGERWDRALRTFRELLLAEQVHFDLVRPAESAEAAFDAVREAFGPR